MQKRAERNPESPPNVSGARTAALRLVIRSLRSGKNLSQGILAERATISQAGMSNYESDKRDMAPYVVVNLAKAVATTSVRVPAAIPSILMAASSRRGACTGTAMCSRPSSSFAGPRVIARSRPRQARP